ncbi:MAG: patatin-like phospholipase family protein [Rikenellaceae bacterium]
MTRRFLAFILTLMLSISHCTAKSIGVVMSGGGAKGLYHIGVLQALEENGIPIDYVAGTSMGAITAGLYAAGYSPDQMREIANSGEIESWVNGRIDNQYGLYFRRGSTLRSEAPTISFRIDPTKGGMKSEGERVRKMPKSLIPTTQIDMALFNYFTPASTAAGDDFSKLMVPFLCVASDVTDNSKYVMTKGDLGESIRASMAIPLAFKPIIREDGHILYDGGIQDNFPWKPMVEEFNPDLIIGSACGVDSWVDSSDLSLLDQAFQLAMNETDYNLPDNGVMIRRDVPVGILDFSNSEAVIQMGYDDTIERMDSIIMSVGRENLLPTEFYSSRRKAFNNSTPKLLFKSYDITGLSEQKSEYAREYMLSPHARRKNKSEDEQRKMDFEELKSTLFSILSSGDFTTDYPKTEYDPLSGSYNFEIAMEHKPSLKLSLGGNISSTPFNQIYIGLNYTDIGKTAKSHFAELYLGPVYTTGRVGYRTDFYANAPMFIDAYYNFDVKNLNHGNFGHLTTITNTLEVKSYDQFFSVGIGAPVKHRSQILFRANIGTERFNYENGAASLHEAENVLGDFEMTRLNYISSKIEIRRSTIDNIYYPSRGSLLSTSVIGVLGHERSLTTLTLSDLESITQTYKSQRTWIGAKVNYKKYFNLNHTQNVSFGVNAELVYTTIPEMYSSTGAQLIMPSYRPTIHSNMVFMPEYSAPRYLAVGVMPNVKVWRELSLRTGCYAMLRDKHDPDTFYIEDNGKMSMQYAAEMAFTYNTTIGPLSLSMSKYNFNSKNNLYLTFNFGYPIFSPRGTFY